MTMVWTVLAIGAALLVATFVYVGWRDRRRVSLADDSAANKVATSESNGHAAERHGQQGVTWNRGQLQGGS